MLAVAFSWVAVITPVYFFPDPGRAVIVVFGLLWLLIPFWVGYFSSAASIAYGVTYGLRDRRRLPMSDPRFPGATVDDLRRIRRGKLWRVLLWSCVMDGGVALAYVNFTFGPANNNENVLLVLGLGLAVFATLRLLHHANAHAGAALLSATMEARALGLRRTG